MHGDTRRLSQVGAGMAMILAPMLFLISSLLGPPHEASKNLADPLPHIAANPDRFLAFVLIGLLAVGLFVPAALGVMHLVAPRRPRLAFGAAVLVMAGLLCSAVVQGVQLVQHQMVHPTADREQMVALLGRLEASAGLKSVFLVFLLGLFLGWALLSIGLLGGRLVPSAVPLLILASLIVNFVGQEIVSRILLVSGLGWLGVIVLKVPAHAWPPMEDPGPTST